MLELFEKSTEFMGLPKKAESEGYKLVHYSGEHIHAITQFIADVYYSSKNFSFECTYESLLNDLELEDKLFCAVSDVLCVYNRDNELCCTGRIISKEYNVLLPFEKEFNFDLNFFMGNGRKVYEFARLASSSKNSFFLISSIFRGLCRLIGSENNVVIAGLDKRVYDSFTKRRFPIYNIGEPKYYLGSYTVPIGIKLSEAYSLFNT
ncbi:MAG: hypothetical protein LBM93_01585 [Oscillospiraceae bacterium]|jgi:hypothetical protein|nr:hypothetical protein [Oscillospiraceae bacterium]